MGDGEATSDLLLSRSSSAKTEDEAGCDWNADDAVVDMESARVEARLMDGMIAGGGESNDVRLTERPWEDRRLSGPATTDAVGTPS